MQSKTEMYATQTTEFTRVEHLSSNYRSEKRENSLVDNLATLDCRTR
jgi:hypothetical protein